MSEESGKSISSTTWWGLGFLITVLVTLIYALWSINEWLEDEQQVPVQKIVITGERTHINDQQVRDLIRNRHAGSFFELNVERVHQDLESMPWIYRASVRKRWPNSLNVYLVEEVASARWNGDSLLNEFGNSFNAFLEDGELADLYGPGGSEKVALNGYRAMQTLLDNAGLEIAEMFLSERFAWNIMLKNGVRLNLGRSEFVDRLQRFVDVYPLLEKNDKTIDYIDLRYDTGLAVGWKSTNSNNNKES